MAELSDDARRNREGWTQANAEHTDARASAAWAEEEITWGVFSVPEVSLGTLGDVGGLDVVELGCGTAYVSAWLARRGARPVGVDVTPAQLATARRCQEETGLVFPLLEASAEDVPLCAGKLFTRMKSLPTVNTRVQKALGANGQPLLAVTMHVKSRNDPSCTALTRLYPRELVTNSVP